MSQENVEMLRSFHEGLNTTGRAPAEFQPDLEIHMFEGSPIVGLTAASMGSVGGARTRSTSWRTVASCWTR